MASESCIGCQADLYNWPAEIQPPRCSACSYASHTASLSMTPPRLEDVLHPSKLPLPFKVERVPTADELEAELTRRVAEMRERIMHDVTHCANEFDRTPDPDEVEEAAEAAWNHYRDLMTERNVPTIEEED